MQSLVSGFDMKEPWVRQLPVMWPLNVLQGRFVSIRKAALKQRRVLQMLTTSALCLCDWWWKSSTLFIWLLLTNKIRGLYLISSGPVYNDGKM